MATIIKEMGVATIDRVFFDIVRAVLFNTNFWNSLRLYSKLDFWVVVEF
jgi:hypothetical protein